MGTPAPVSRINKKSNVMLQKAKKKYTVETLKPLNVLYDHEHGLTQQDVDMANNYVELIERTRSEKSPQVGDRLIYVDRYGIRKVLRQRPHRKTGGNERTNLHLRRALYSLCLGKI